jgi:NAD(P)-dependent dehydrogenase (short-subunit alcohol dehydrogenase family)
MVENGSAPEQPMAGKVCLVTGGSGGIGFVTARALAGRGATTLIIARDPSRGQAAAAAIREAAGHERVRFLAADLADQSQLRAAAAEVLREHARIDVLVNNAGGLFGRRSVTADGIERTFALNHLSYFLMTHLLLPALQRAAPARIVNVASAAHKSVTLDFNDLQGEEHYDRWIAYKRSKLANVMFTYELARRIEGSGVTANALHPGFVATEIGTRHGFVPGLLWGLGTLAAVSPEEGAKTSIYLASSPEVAGVSGRYFSRGREKRSSEASYDRDASLRLWDVSINLTGLDSRQN